MRWVLVALVAIGTSMGCGWSPAAAAPERAQEARPEGRSPRAVLTDDAELREPPTFAPRPFVGSESDQDAILRTLELYEWVEARPVGVEELLFDVRLTSGDRALFIPATRTAPRVAHEEVAAYRVARVLGMDNVPPAMTAWVTVEHLEAVLDPAYRDVWPTMRTELSEAPPDPIHPDAVRGALVYLATNIRERTLARYSSVWMARLNAPIDADVGSKWWDADLSRMVLYDYLIGYDERAFRPGPFDIVGRERLMLRDHRGAFRDWTGAEHREARDRIRGVRRFSARFVRGLARLDEASLRAELGRDPGAPLLDERAIRAFCRRRDALVSYVISWIEPHENRTVVVYE